MFCMHYLGKFFNLDIAEEIWLFLLHIFRVQAGSKI